MLSGQHFYHRITRKMVVSFGTLFNNIRLVRYNKAGTVEIERIIVPLMYAQKEKFFQRISQDPELTKETQMTLPRMSFELDAITYDPLRKTSIFNTSIGSGLNGSSLRTTRMSPYNFDFTLSIYVRNTEDGTQIVEQILPYFSPDYTITLDPTGLGDKIDVPIILNSVNYDVEDVGGPDNIRVLIWNLTFTLKGYMFGPISNTSVIRQATANTYDSTFNNTGKREITVGSGSGTFKIGELVYEGKTLTSANSTGYVQAWSNTANTLVITGINGILKTNRAITGYVSNASYTISSFDDVDTQLVKITIKPDPLTANANTAFGFDETITEFPNIT